MRRAGLLPVFVGILLPVAYCPPPAFGQTPPSRFKGALGPLPLPSGGSTKEILTRIDEATAKGRAAYQASRDFDDRYRTFLKALREAQKAGSPAAVCKNPEAAKAYLEASGKLGEFKTRRAEFSGLLGPLRAAQGDKDALTPARLGQIDRILRYDSDAAALEPALEALYAEQMLGEVTALGCSDEALVLASKEKPSLAPAYAPAPANAQPQPWMLPVAKPGKVPFTINNVDCDTAFSVVMDGEPLGKATPNAVTSFSATAGWHWLCLAPDGSPDACQSSSAGVRTYLYEGWWVRAQCPSLTPVVEEFED
jgi:hypothetical protein